MRKKLLSLPLALICCLALGQSPANAAGDSEITNPVELGVRTVGILSGMVVGVPIATVKEMPESVSRNVRAVATAFTDDGDPDEAQIVVATIPGLMLGLCDGLVTGTSKGVINAYREEPFSLGSFSLDE